MYLILFSAVLNSVNHFFFVFPSMHPQSVSLTHSSATLAVATVVVPLLCVHSCMASMSALHSAFLLLVLAADSNPHLLLTAFKVHCFRGCGSVHFDSQSLSTDSPTRRTTPMTRFARR